MRVFLISFFIVLYKKHKIYFIIRKRTTTTTNPTVNTQEGRQRCLAVRTGLESRSRARVWCGNSVSVMGNTPGLAAGSSQDY